MVVGMVLMLNNGQEIFMITPSLETNGSKQPLTKHELAMFIQSQTDFSVKDKTRP